LNFLDVYVISHKRDTLSYCLKCLAAQTYANIACVYIDIESADATNDIVQNTTAPFFLRVDDDMYLHKKAVAYINEVCRDNKHSPMLAFKLYDTALASSSWCGTVKAYNTDVCRNYVFTDNGDWSLDHNFVTYLRQQNCKYYEDASVVGLHAHLAKADTEVYLKKLKNKYPSVERWYGTYKFDKRVTGYNGSPSKQYEAHTRLIEKDNLMRGTDFNLFMRNNK